MTPTCPYCGSTNLDEPKWAITPGNEAELAKHGLTNYLLQKCLDCTSTLMPEQFTGEVPVIAEAPLFYQTWEEAGCK